MRLYCRYTCNMLLCQRNKKDSMGESGQIITWVHVLLYLQHISDKQTQPYNKLQLKIIFTLSLTSPLQALNSAAPNNQNLWMHHKPGFPFTWCTPTFLSVLVNSTTGNSPNKSYSRPWKVLGNRVWHSRSGKFLHFLLVLELVPEKLVPKKRTGTGTRNGEFPGISQTFPRPNPEPVSKKFGTWKIRYRKKVEIQEPPHTAR